jgi:hypothetical protein
LFRLTDCFDLGAFGARFDQATAIQRAAHAAAIVTRLLTVNEIHVPL